MKPETTSVTPWYKQFWPWFIIALPASVVVAGLTTVYIAFNNADTLVNDNYYKDGLAINQTLAQDAEAHELGLEAAVTFDSVSGEVFVDISGELPPGENLELLLLHPVDQDSDRSIPLISLGGGRYRADLDRIPMHRYYLRLQPVDHQRWRLNGELNFNLHAKVILTSNV